MIPIALLIAGVAAVFLSKKKRPIAYRRAYLSVNAKPKTDREKAFDERKARAEAKAMAEKGLGEDVIRAALSKKYGPVGKLAADKFLESDLYKDFSHTAGGLGKTLKGAGEAAWDEVSGWFSGEPNDLLLQEFVLAQGDSIRNLIPRVQANMGQFVGTFVEVNGSVEQITLSGLVGLVTRAGTRGALSWLAYEEDRAMYPSTTSAFVATNGIF